jgi:pimeloyl-ACP methyl ester carboxylesterase
MKRISEIRGLIEQARTGIVAPVGNLEQADELIGFSFGTYLNSEGQLDHPGPVNDAIARFVVCNEVLRSKNMTLQEELAVAIEAIEPKMANQIDSLPTIKKPGVVFNTHELLATAQPKFRERNVGSLAVVAFRHHLPRAAAEVRKAGFVVATPDMSIVGDFDPNNPQKQVRSAQDWYDRENKVIPIFALLNRI